METLTNAEIFALAKKYVKLRLAQYALAKEFRDPKEMRKKMGRRPLPTSDAEVNLRGIGGSISILETYWYRPSNRVRKQINPRRACLH